MAIPLAMQPEVLDMKLDLKTMVRGGGLNVQRMHAA